jgi:hypothetical protein
MSCSRHSSAIVLWPRSDANTISVFCCAVNLRYLRVSLNEVLPRVERPMLDSEPDGASAPLRGASPSQSERAKCQHDPGVHANPNPTPITSWKSST